MLPLLDLYSGIGGFSLGLERSGAFRTVAFCEQNPYCQRVLAQHWSGVPIYDDVRSLTADRLAADGIRPRAICGGFPCQDISGANPDAEGIDGARSGLWREYARLVGEIRPEVVVVENVAALLGRGLYRVLGDLAALGFDAEWHCIPAAAVGAPHRRDRIWIVAYPNGEAGRSAARDADASTGREEVCVGAPKPGRCGAAVADAGGAGLSLPEQARWGIEIEAAPHQWGPASERGWWATEPDVGRVAHGVPARVDRLRCLGNAVVPQIPEIIGRVIASRIALQPDHLPGEPK